MRSLALPELEMELRLTIDRIYSTQNISCLDLVISLDLDISQLAVKSVIVTVINHHTLVISGKDHDLTYDSVKHRLCLLTFGNSKVETIVLRHDYIIHRMTVRSETSDHGSFDRPRKFSLIPGKFSSKLLVNDRLLCRRRGTDENIQYGYKFCKRNYTCV